MWTCLCWAQNSYATLDPNDVFFVRFYKKEGGIYWVSGCRNLLCVCFSVKNPPQHLAKCQPERMLNFKDKMRSTVAVDVTLYTRHRVCVSWQMGNIEPNWGGISAPKSTQRNSNDYVKSLTNLRVIFIWGNGRIEWKRLDIKKKQILYFFPFWRWIWFNDGNFRGPVVVLCARMGNNDGSFVASFPGGSLQGNIFLANLRSADWT